MAKILDFTKTDAENFIKTYNEARRDELDVFDWKGNQFIIDYAYYVIEYFVQKKLIAGNFFENKIFNLKSKTK